MQFIILLVHVLLCVSLIALVLLQHGKGADIGATFGIGGGASSTFFGSTGASSFLMKLTGAVAVLFFLTTIFLGYLETHRASPDQFQLPIGKSSTVIPGNAPPKTPKW